LLPGPVVPAQTLAGVKLGLAGGGQRRAFFVADATIRSCCGDGIAAVEGMPINPKMCYADLLERADQKFETDCDIFRS